MPICILLYCKNTMAHYIVRTPWHIRLLEHLRCWQRILWQRPLIIRVIEVVHSLWYGWQTEHLFSLSNILLQHSTHQTNYPNISSAKSVLWPSLQYVSREKWIPDLTLGLCNENIFQIRVEVGGGCGWGVISWATHTSVIHNQIVRCKRLHRKFMSVRCIIPSSHLPYFQWAKLSDRCFVAAGNPQLFQERVLLRK